VDWIKDWLEDWEDKLSVLIERYNALNLRERAIIFGAVLVAVYGLWSSFVLTPMEADVELITKRYKELHQKAKSLQESSASVSQDLAYNPNAENQNKKRTLEHEIARLDEKLSKATTGMIRPSQMVDVLEDLLQEQEGLQLEGMQALEPEPLFAEDETGEGDGSPGATAEALGATDMRARKPQTPNQEKLYKHSFVIELRGEYFPALRYLKEIEALEWSLSWESLRYEVTSYPEAKITLKVGTLSSAEGWIGV